MLRLRPVDPCPAPSCAERLTCLADIFWNAEGPLTAAEILGRWPVDRRPAVRTLNRDLRELCRRRVLVRINTGRGFRYIELDGADPGEHEEPDREEVGAAARLPITAAAAAASRELASCGPVEVTQGEHPGKGEGSTHQ